MSGFRVADTLVAIDDDQRMRSRNGSACDRSAVSPEHEYKRSAALETNGTTWLSLALIYHREARLTEEIGAWERACALLPYPSPELLALGYAELAAHHPQKALQKFDKAAANPPPQRERRDSQRFLANLARGRAIALSALGQQR